MNDLFLPDIPDITTVDRLQEFIRLRPPGSKARYAEGRGLVVASATGHAKQFYVHVWKEFELGKIHLLQRKLSGEQYEYLLVRRTQPRKTDFVKQIVKAEVG